MDMDKTWQEIKEDYLGQVETVLLRANRDDRRTILRDVEDHLNQRFNDLPSHHRSRDEFERIITDMGPAQDYAELLDNKETPQPADYTPSDGLILMNRLSVIFYLAVLFCVVGWTVQNGLTVGPYREQWVPPFVSDSQLPGKWIAVDFVKETQDFTPSRRSTLAGDLYLKEMIFHADGTTNGPWRWTKGDIYQPDDKSHAKYQIKQMDGRSYLFFEWMSGDVRIRGQKPWYYVLQKEEGQ